MKELKELKSSLFDPEYQAMLTYRGLLYNAQFYFYAFAALAIAIAASILVWLRRKTSVMDLHFGALVFIWLFPLPLTSGRIRSPSPPLTGTPRGRRAPSAH